MPSPGAALAGPADARAQGRAARLLRGPVGRLRHRGEEQLRQVRQPTADAKVVFDDKSLAFGVADLSVQVSKMKQAGRRPGDHLHGHQRRGHPGQGDEEAAADAIQYLPDGYDHSSSRATATCSRARSCAPTSPSSSCRGHSRPAWPTTSSGSRQAEHQPQRGLDERLAQRRPVLNGLKAAGPDFSRQKLIDAINKMTDYTGQRAAERRELDGGAHQSRRHVLPVLLDDQEQQVRDELLSQPGKPFICVVDSGREADRPSTPADAGSRRARLVSNLSNLLQYAVAVASRMRVRVRAAGRRADAQLQDVGRVQPGLRGPGLRLGRGVLRAAPRARLAAAPGRLRGHRACSASLIAWVLDRFLYRHQRTATPLAKLVTSLGLLVAMPADRAAGPRAATSQDRPAAAGPGAATAIDFLWPNHGPVRARRQPDRHHRLHRRGGHRSSSCCSGGARSACGCGRWSRARACSSSRASTPSGWRCRRGCCPACWPAWPACSSPRCSPSSTPTTSSPCWWRPSPPACWAT